MIFKNRKDAGRQLAAALSHYRGRPAIVFPLPRGGVVLGVEVAQALSIPLDLIVPRKIGHPGNPEYAVCALAEDGTLFCDPYEVEQLDADWLRASVAREHQEALRRRTRYMQGQAPLDVAGKIAILVDDGIATGLTMQAAIHDARQRQAASIVVAIPVVPEDICIKLRSEVDDVIALDSPARYLGAVGAYFEDFDQVSDAEVMRLLSQVQQDGDAD
ncbi:phosphoribosyltransferase [Marinobacterium rhizophilum]|uniref:phosphoribosyltransferase n=1 Tax=Marinobacterium rhizophilum TaxID=420402 RepID=UPI0003719CC3|nr:phosphoribosyltransferase family protein [Marinobacterium rhizophilum]